MRWTMFVILVAAIPAFAADWPQWMGPNRDDQWKETGILQKFPKDGPKKLWSVPINGGYSGPAVANGKVYVTDFLPSEGERGNNPNAQSKRKGRNAWFASTRRLARKNGFTPTTVPIR